MKKYKVAVMGATGAVGREVLKTLSERNFPVSEVVALASSRSAGSEVSYGEDKVLKVLDLAHYDFKGTSLCFGAAGSKISAEYAPKAGAAGCIVIDKTSEFRVDRDVPLIVPEVNPEALPLYKKRNIIAVPNCSTIPLVMVLKPLHTLATVKRVVVATYQSVSGAGREGMDELFNQTRAIFVNDPLVKEQFKKQIAFNVIPQIDIFMDDGSTKEEWKMIVETKKILGPEFKVSATCVRVPVFVGHSEAVSIEFERDISVAEARRALAAFPGISVVDHHHEEGFVTPVECAGEDQTFVSRLRKDTSVPFGLNLWLVTDNLRKGAALNAVQIAELLVQQGL